MSTDHVSSVSQCESLILEAFWMHSCGCIGRDWGQENLQPWCVVIGHWQLAWGKTSTLLQRCRDSHNWQQKNLQVDMPVPEKEIDVEKELTHTVLKLNINSECRVVSMLVILQTCCIKRSFNVLKNSSTRRWWCQDKDFFLPAIACCKQQITRFPLCLKTPRRRSLHSSWCADSSIDPLFFWLA